MRVEDLYQEDLLDHARKPHNCCELPGATHLASGRNPLCGDEVAVFVIIKDGVIEQVSFKGKGCVISQASASIMTDALMGKPLDEAKRCIEETMAKLKDGSSNFETSPPEVQILQGVRAFPTRLKCALLAWKAASDAITSTEK